MSQSTVIHATESSFDAEVLQADQPVLVDFWAEWCGPCRAIAPVIEDVARRRQAGLRVVKVDVDANPKLAQRYGIRSIPSLLLFGNGALLAQQSGSLRRAELDAFLDRQGVAAGG